MDYVTLKDIDAKGYYPLPKNLFNNKHYQIRVKSNKKIKGEVKEIISLKEKLNDTSKIIYSILCEKLSESVANGWWDENKRVYVKFSIYKLCEMLNKTKDTIIKCKKELEDCELIKIVSGGSGKSDTFYIGKIKARPVEDIEVDYLDKTGESFFTQPVEKIDQSKVSSKTGRKVLPEPVEKFDPNNYYNNYIITTSSSGEKFSFLNTKDFPLLDLGTINNIKKYIPDIQESYFKKVYAALENDFNQGKIKSFNGALFTALKNNWNLTISPQNKIDPDEIKQKIKERCNYWADFYSISRDKEDTLNRFLADVNIYSADFLSVVEEYKIKLLKFLNKER